ncbi:MAG TPA: hypothetical protein VGD71_43000 [Kribbella sp.]
MNFMRQRSTAMPPYAYGAISSQPLGRTSGALVVPGAGHWPHVRDALLHTRRSPARQCFAGPPLPIGASRRRG